MKDELYHHGIEGQRWGVQHGPPYPLSRAENRAIRKKAKAEKKSKEASEKRNLSYKKSGKYSKRMTNEDLNATIDRLQREETYRRLVSKDKEAKKQASSSNAQASDKQKNQNNQPKKDSYVKELIKKIVTASSLNYANAVSKEKGRQKAEDMKKKYEKVENENTFDLERNQEKVKEAYEKDRYTYNYVNPKTKKKAAAAAGAGVAAAIVIPKLMASSVSNVSSTEISNYIKENMPLITAPSISGYLPG